MMTNTLEPKTPKTHQAAAISACIAGLKRNHSRGQCIMACGTGKTIVGYEVAHGLKAKRVLALVPSLLLVNQLAKAYREQGAKNIMSVCSDESVGGEDALHVSVKELETANTQNAEVAREFLDGPGQRIVICTYQSLRNLAEVFEGLHFDLAIFDEAHKTAGSKSKLFAHALQDNGLKCARRLFMTATPRHAKLREDGKESPVFSMNDPKVYGPVLYSLPLRTAIEAGIIDDYWVIVALVSQKNAEEFREQAVRIAIDRAMRNYGICKVFTFHARVADASGFILGATDTLKSARLYHVNGNQSRAERELKLAGFANADKALMSNARCLTEGVDLPAADMVAFLAPKRNPIDIVQAIGRVLRKHPSKAQGGYVFLPVFVREGEDEEEAIMGSPWAGVYEVLQALREQDAPMAAAMAKCARGDGELPDKILLFDTRKPVGVGTEADRRELSEGMRRSIRVKMMRPFRADPGGRKRELLALAESGAKRPWGKSRDPHERMMGRALDNYTQKNCSSFDAEFTAKIRAISPRWFGDGGWRRRAQERRDEIIRMATAHSKKPHCEAVDPRERELGVTLTNAANRKLRSYNPVFIAQLKVIAPEWFDELKPGEKRIDKARAVQEQCAKLVKERCDNYI